MEAPEDGQPVLTRPLLDQKEVATASCNPQDTPLQLLKASKEEIVSFRRRIAQSGTPRTDNILPLLIHRKQQCYSIVDGIMSNNELCIVNDLLD